MVDIFRPCAGAIVFNKEGKVFLGSRIETKDFAWQFPQGGIENGETPAQAARRELYEETGIKSVELLYTTTNAFRYTFPKEIKALLQKKGRNNAGQDIYFSLFYFTGNDDEINLNLSNPEFSNYCWADFNFANANIVSFKREVYEDVSRLMEPKIKDYICHLT